MLTSTLGIVMIVIAAVLGLLALEGLVLAAAERPWFKHPHPDQMQTTVRGGIHLGDPRSVSPSPENEAAAPTRPVDPAPAGPAPVRPEAEARAGEQARSAPAGLGHNVR